MSRNGNILSHIDWLTFFLFIAIALFGCVNIYGASYTYEQAGVFDFSNRAVKQLIWLGVALLMGSIIMIIDTKTYDVLAYIIYGFWLLVLLITPILAKNTNGSLSWISLGSIKLQPAELAKCFTALALSKYMSRYEYKVNNLKDLFIPAVILGVPMLIIMILQKETGSALVFASFMIMFYRQGMTGYIFAIIFAAVVFFVVAIKFGAIALPLGLGCWGLMACMILINTIGVVYLLIKLKKPILSAISAGGSVVIFGICLIVNIWLPLNFEWVATAATIYSTFVFLYAFLRYRHREYLYILLFTLFSVLFCYSSSIMFNKVLKPHQRVRIEVLLGLNNDIKNAGYNVNQARIAIGSGGLSGKGFLKGTQTQLQFVPEQATDFIFCTVGEEWGFIGSAGLLIVYLVFLLRLIVLAERQKDTFSMIFGYCVVGIFFFHLFINVGMVLGLLPVIGIPLPFFSYGGSSMIAFSLLLFIFLRLDASRVEKM